jgi:lysophospholipase L1-like esterase
MRKTVKKTGSIMANLLLVLASLLFTAGAAELVLRLAGHDTLGELRGGREQLLRPAVSPEVRYEHIPGARAHAWNVEVAINAEGNRGRSRTPGEFQGKRIVLLGDSITFGNFLDVQATYADQLQALLDKRAGNAYEVLNFGVGGYDTVQEVAQLEQRAADYRPDLVVVGFCLNDLGVVSLNLEYIDRLEQYRTRLLYRSYLARFLASEFERLRTGSWMNSKNDPEVFARDYAGSIDAIGADEQELRGLMQQVPNVFPSEWYGSDLRVGRLRHAFARLQALAQREGFKVVVLIFPWLIEEQGEYPHAVAHKIIAHEARRAHFEVLDLLPDYRQEGLVSLRISDADYLHPNARGHSIAARRLADYILATSP